MLGDRNALFLRSDLGKSDPLINLPTAGPEDLSQDLPDRLQLHGKSWPAKADSGSNTMRLLEGYIRSRDVTLDGDELILVGRFKAMSNDKETPELAGISCQGLRIWRGWADTCGLVDELASGPWLGA
ncbi:MAG: hypothetical protein WA137_00115 [Methanothrix sp.]